MQPAIMNPLSGLPPDLIWLISQFVLDNDVVDYISFRAVCREWRLYTDPPVGLDSRFRPRSWIILSEGNDANLDPSRRRFLNLATGRCLMLHLPQLDTFSVFSDADGLLLLIDQSSKDVWVLNPFTGHLASLPTLPSYSRGNVKASFMRSVSRSCISSGSHPTVMLLRKSLRAIFYAKPGDSMWVVYYFRGKCPMNMLCLRDQFYFAHPRCGIARYHSQEKWLESVIPLTCGIFSRFYVAEFNQEMLLVHENDDSSFSVYRVDLESNGLVPMFNNRHHAIFVGQRCLALSLLFPWATNQRSLKPNSIYFCSAATVFNMDDHGGAVSHDGYYLVSPPIGPLSLAQYLTAYCLYSY